MFLNEEEQCSRLRAAADKKDMTLIDYEELYNKRAEWKPDRYEVANYSVRKTHVKKIEVIR